MDKEDIFSAIETCSAEIIAGENSLPTRIKRARNFVANKSMKDWAFTKMVAGEHFDVFYGSSAKPFFKSNNFINILELPDSLFRTEVISKFMNWSDSIPYYDLRAAFSINQNIKNKFELLVHKDSIPNSN